MATISSWTKLSRSLLKLILPVVLILLIAFLGASYWLTYTASIPARSEYLVTPEKYSRLSERGARITEETWSNRDSTTARGWLLRGSEGAPAVILLPRFGADRSWTLNLGVKLNEATNYTILMPDLRGHGQAPKVGYCSFGGCETDDANAAVTYLRDLKSDGGKALVGRDIGIYGVELGGYAALLTASKEQIITTIVADSVPPTPDALLRSTVKKKAGFAPDLSASLASFGSMLYFRGCYTNADVCGAVKTLTNRNILLLAGKDAPEWIESTAALQKCLGKQAELQIKTDLTVSGYNPVNTTSEASDNYDRLIIEFFKKSLGNATAAPTAPPATNPTNSTAPTVVAPPTSTNTNASSNIAVPSANTSSTTAPTNSANVSANANK